ncbi:MAG: hypothetical protein PWQ09_876 [Candidatus Cloacimonadota bacterium]|jgi:hypothetical protein|nr:hypothetical protein [Candidatus Cloacimonadota bacterium]
MKKTSVLFLTIIFTSILTSSSQVYRYHETVQDPSAIAYYEVIKTDTLIKRIYRIGNERQTSCYKQEHQTTKFIFQNSKSNFKVFPQDNKLIANGIKEGRNFWRNLS